MLRLLPTFKGRLFVLNLPLFPTRCSSYSCATSLQISNGLENETKEIDFEHLFNACTKTHLLKRLHTLLIVSGKAQSIFIATRLVNIYAHLGDISLSRSTFDGIPRKDTYIWNSILSAYVRNGCYHEAVNSLYEMLSTSQIRPDFYTFPPILKACGNLIDGKRIHCSIFKLGFQWDVFVAASLVHMYCRFGDFKVAHRIFNEMPFRDMGCWNSVISGFCQNGNTEEALQVLDQMRLEGIKMDSVTVSTMLPICAQLGDLLRGVLIHLHVIKHGLDSDIFVCNALINMYAKFGRLGHAQKVFDEMLVRDLVSWNSIIAAYEQNDDPNSALDFFNQMQFNAVQPDLLTLVSLASSVAQTKDLRYGKSVHGYTLRRYWIFGDVIVGNAVVDMYAKLGFIESARKVFDEIPYRDVISWNTMITGYAQNGLASEAIETYSYMIEECKDITPNQGTWVSILPAYAHLGALREGTRTHAKVLKTSLHFDVFVGTCLIDLYGKCGELDDAMLLFNQVPRITSVPWNSIILCYGIHGHGEKSLQLFNDMLNEGVNPDQVTFLSLLSACSHSGLVEQGQWCFSIMKEKYNINPNLKHYGSMVDLLGRAGHLQKAYDFIEKMPLKPDASVWGALLGACRIHGNIELGKWASDRLFEVDSNNVGYYVLLSNIYANTGKWQGVDEIRSMAKNRGLKKTPGWTSIELNNKIEVFYTGNKSHPQFVLIHEELKKLTQKMKGLGYVPDYSFVLQDVEEDEKEQILNGHSERLAIAYAIINSGRGTSIRIFKNLRVCGDCHNATKFISKITRREIIVRDSNRFHHFRDGACSCRDFW